MSEIESSGPFWFVRAGRASAFVDDFVSGGWVGVGSQEAGWVDPSASDEEIEAAIRRGSPNEKEGSIRSWVSQTKRFLRDLQVGDPVATYDGSQRLYFLGSIASGAEREDEHPLVRRRRVEWTHKVSRDSLSAGTRNTLGSTLTLFRVHDAASNELRQKAVLISDEILEVGVEPPEPAESPDGEGTSETILRDDIADKADAFVEDRIARLTWQEMEELVAGLLRAMGYRTRVSDTGADRGVDVFASPDGLGLEEPRIFAEVKHRRGSQMGAPEIRAFLGGRQAGDRCIYVSTGGFTREARYEADRATVPLRLISLPELRELLVEYYESMDAEARALVPLKRIYWPAD